MALVKEYRLGRSDDIETTLGPVVRSTAAEFVRGQINDAVNSGAIAHIDAKSFPLNSQELLI